MALEDEDQEQSAAQQDALQQNALAPQQHAPPQAGLVESVHSCRLPPFWRASPEAWYMQVEAALEGNQIRHDPTRYNLALAKLDADTVQDMLDVLRAVPATGKFAYLKEHILKRFGDTKEERLNKLLATVSTEGRKPSQVLHHIRRLAGDQASDDLLKVKWLNLLPSTARGVLSVLDTATLDKLAEAADKFMDSTPTINAAGPSNYVSRTPSPGRGFYGRSGSNGMACAPTDGSSALSSMAADMAALRGSMSQLLAINRLMLDRLSQPAASQDSRGRSQGRARSRQRGSSSNGGICHYHRKFGADARRCELPCAFSSTTNQGN